MKKILLFLTAPLLALGWQLQDHEAHKAHGDERAAVERAVLDYCEGFYEVKPELIERSVSKELTKYGYWRSDPSAEYKGTAMNFDQAVALAKRWNTSGEQVPDGAPKKVEIYEILDQTASVKLTAVWGIDYMLLSKDDGKWKIRHVMWQSHTDGSH
ncbi:MAG: nuclear transport factor 2 family protein [Planctomycetota bacterium]